MPPPFSASSLVASSLRIYFSAACPFVPDLPLRPLSLPPPRLLLRRAPPLPRGSSRRRAAANSGAPPPPPGDDSDDLSGLQERISRVQDRILFQGTQKQHHRGHLNRAPSGNLAVPCRAVILKEHVLLIIGKSWYIEPHCFGMEAHYFNWLLHLSSPQFFSRLAFRLILPPAYRIPPSQVLFGWL